MNRRTFLDVVASAAAAACTALSTSEAAAVTLHVYKNDCEWMVAGSLDEAYSIDKTLTGIDREEFEEYDPLERMRDEATVTILCNEHGEIDDHGESVTRTAAEWAKREGRGMLCTTEY